MTVYSWRYERLKPRERERERRARGKESARVEASERVVDAEKDLEPWEAPITVARVRLPSGTRFIPQLLRTSISSAHTNIKCHQYSEAITSLQRLNGHACSKVLLIESISNAHRKYISLNYFYRSIIYNFHKLR